MKMRALRWNLVAWYPSSGPADPFGAPRLMHIAWRVRARSPLIFLAVGAVLMVVGLAPLHSTAAFIAGLVLVGSSAGGAQGPRSPTTAMVRTWEWLRKGRADHR